jgi:hypothetical protein
MTEVEKLVRAGEQGGFSVDLMIQLLERGATVETLLQLIEWRLSPPMVEPHSSRWVM